MKILILIAVTLLSSCSMLEGAVSKGGEFNDDALNGADIVYCKAASIGSVTRKMTVKEYLELRRVLCDNVWATE